MVCVLGVRFREAGKLHYYEASEEVYGNVRSVIAETVRGIEYGRVVIGTKHFDEQDVVLTPYALVRPGNATDAQIVAQNKQLAQSAYRRCGERIRLRGLPMKLVECEYTFDCQRVIFYFTADGRVDFRELVKDLAAMFRTRIELRQIGVRDEAKLLGGIGPCGRITCCSSWLGDFLPVSIKMAKDQNLSLNPVKISGLCGRLMCCLKYEHDQYESVLEQIPALGEHVATPRGKAVIVGIDAMQRTVRVRLQGFTELTVFPVEEVIAIDPDKSSVAP